MKSGFSDWVYAVWRFVRVFLAAGVAQVVVLQVNWAKPEEAIKTIYVAFGAGVISAVFKYIRDKGYLTWLPL